MALSLDGIDAYIRGVAFSKKAADRLGIASLM